MWFYVTSKLLSMKTLWIFLKNQWNIKGTTHERWNHDNSCANHKWNAHQKIHWNPFSWKHHDNLNHGNTMIISLNHGNFTWWFEISWSLHSPWKWISCTLRLVHEHNCPWFHVSLVFQKISGVFMNKSSGRMQRNWDLIPVSVYM